MTDPNSNPNQQLSPLIIGVNTAAFTLSFAVWVMFGPSIRGISTEFHLPLPMATLIKTLPVLVGSVMRIPVGLLTDRIGARRTFPLLMLVAATSVYALSWASTAGQLIAGSLAMGMVGTTFVVGVQSVSAWTPKEKRGFALGVFGAGNVGTALTTFGLPLLLTAWGWRGAFRVYALVMVAASVLYTIMIREAPRQGAVLHFGALLEPLKSAHTWRFGLYYMATFGTFVAATLTITDIYADGYRMPLKTAGLLATTFTCAASLFRIPGGRLADRFGASRMTRLSLIAIGISLTPVCFGVPLPLMVVLVFASGIAMGFGMAAVIRYIPDYFPNAVGSVGGLVGALGGLGGFFLPQLGEAMKWSFGSTYLQIIPLAASAMLALAIQHQAERYQAEQRIPSRAEFDNLAGLSALHSAVSEPTPSILSDAGSIAPTPEREAGEQTPR